MRSLPSGKKTGRPSKKLKNMEVGNGFEHLRNENGVLEFDRDESRPDFSERFNVHNRGHIILSFSVLKVLHRRLQLLSHLCYLQLSLKFTLKKTTRLTTKEKV